MAGKTRFVWFAGVAAALLLFFLMMTRAVWMVACQVTLVIAGAVGLSTGVWASWSLARWTLLLAIPLVLGIAVGAYVWLVPWQAQGVEFPLAGSIRFEFQSVGPGRSCCRRRIFRGDGGRPGPAVRGRGGLPL